MESFEQRGQRSRKSLRYALKEEQRHWVGDGFFVHGLIRPTENLSQLLSPFVLMDYVAPIRFEPSKIPRGVGEHPHKGFETVTIAYQGEVSHRDSSGGGGTIRKGDVQWMTAGRGIVHEEFHSTEFSRQGGIFEMVQLWVNLPKKDKLVNPGYQGLVSETIPDVDISDDVTLRVIAGDYDGVSGPASTYSPINIFDIKTRNESRFTLNLKEGSSTALLIRRGKVTLDQRYFSDAELLVFDQKGQMIELLLSDDFEGLVLNGEPLNEPVIAHGPFVMNTKEEIIQAMNEYRNGDMGRLSET